MSRRKAQRLVREARQLIGSFSFIEVKPFDFDASYRLYKRYYEETYRRVTALFPDLRDAAATAVPPHIDAAFDVYIYGRDLSNAILHGKEIPPSLVKKFSAAFKIFNRKRKIKEYVPWFAKNIAQIKLLLESDSWPDKGSSERTKTVGPFTVINQVGQDISTAEKALLSAASFIRDSKVPGSDKILYGEVFVVGEISRKRTVMARYRPGNDTIELLLLKRFSGKSSLSLTHEFGHRLWTRFLSNSVKTNWRAHHDRIDRAIVDINFPPVGEPVSAIKGNPKVQRYEGDRIYLESGGYITTRQYENFMESYGRERKFPTPYSAKNAEEHFCEAFALYCLGDLKEPHRSDFEALVVRS